MLKRRGNMQQKAVWLVLLVDYDDCTHLAAFSNEDAANDYADDYEQFARYGDAVVSKMLLDQPREVLRGGWEVLVDADGNEVLRYTQDYHNPAHEGSHYQRLDPPWKADEMTEPMTGDAVGRGFGLTPEIALANARKAIRRGTHERERAGYSAGAVCHS